jgi:uncharacterized protein DUF4124
MKTLIGVLLALAAGSGLAADAYKWVDEKGVTNYGEKPPQSRSAQPVNTVPSGIIEGGNQFTQKPVSPDRRADEPAPLAPPYAAPPTPGSMAARGMEFDVFIRLQRGMTEGELLLRAGPPDYQGMESAYYDIEKSYYYFPTIANPYTTVVKVRGGRIASLDRIKKF